MSAPEQAAGVTGGQEAGVPATVAEAVDGVRRDAGDPTLAAAAGGVGDAADEGAAERAALAGELFAPGVGAQAGPPRTPARESG